MFNKNQREIKSYPNDQLIALARQHIDDGYSFSSFSGKYGLTAKNWTDLSRELPELIELRKVYNEKSNKNKWRKFSC